MLIMLPVSLERILDAMMHYKGYFIHYGSTGAVFVTNKRHETILVCNSVKSAKMRITKLGKEISL
jgi:hypothetical protein